MTPTKLKLGQWVDLLCKPDTSSQFILRIPFFLPLQSANMKKIHLQKCFNIPLMAMAEGTYSAIFIYVDIMYNTPILFERSMMIRTHPKYPHMQSNCPHAKTYHWAISTSYNHVITTDQSLTDNRQLTFCGLCTIFMKKVNYAVTVRWASAEAQCLELLVSNHLSHLMTKPTK